MTDPAEPIDLDAIKRDHDVACDYHQLRMTISHRQRGQLIAEVERLRARVEELERDAARYRHLRDDAGNGIMRTLMKYASADAWDRTVDAAMGEGER